MTPRDVIAQHLCDCPPTILTTFAAEATARRIEGVLSTAGFVIVPTDPDDALCERAAMCAEVNAALGSKRT